MELKLIHDKETIKEYLLDKNKSNFMYHLSYLTKGFLEYAQFYGLYENDDLKATAIFCINYGMPILIGSSYVEYDNHQDELIKKISDFLPQNLYCHLNINTSKYLLNNRKLGCCVKYYNMKLNKEYFLKNNKDINFDIHVKRMEASEKDKLLEFLDKNHPGYMLEEKFFNEGLYHAIELADNTIVSVCGIFSDSSEVIQIGNVSTAIEYRKKGLARRCLYEIIKTIMPMNKDIVLNVKQDNKNALNLYSKMGFEVIGEFEEVTFE